MQKLYGELMGGLNKIPNPEDYIETMNKIPTKVMDDSDKDRA